RDSFASSSRGHAESGAGRGDGGLDEQARDLRAGSRARLARAHRHPWAGHCGDWKRRPRRYFPADALLQPRQLSPHRSFVCLAVRDDDVMVLQRGAPRRGCRRTAWRALRYAHAHALRDHHRGGAARLDHAAWRERPTLARDATFATLMIVLNGMVDTALLMGALRIGSRNIISPAHAPSWW